MREASTPEYYVLVPLEEHIHSIIHVLSISYLYMWINVSRQVYCMIYHPDQNEIEDPIYLFGPKRIRTLELRR